MDGKRLFSRREFIKTSSIAALMAGCSSPTSNEPEPKVVRVQVNPNIDNLRVVCCHDPNMIVGDYGSSFRQQNDAIDTEVVERNLDEMAKTLAIKNTDAEAWETIFRKPDSKSWDQVKCAIKVNCINTQNMHRIAIVGKIASVFIALGVSPSNIVIYDGCHNANGTLKYTPYVGNGLPSGVIVSNRSSALNGIVSLTVEGFNVSRTCTADMANGVVDILVNCALNKGHSSNAGGMTLCMKNHFGTFNPCCSNIGESYRVPYIIAINQHEAIIGGSPVRQQLCIVDSLWAATDGPMGPPTHTTARIVMGTFAPAVDYITTKRIREDVMGDRMDRKVIQFMTAFGYTENQCESLDLVSVSPA